MFYDLSHMFFKVHIVLEDHIMLSQVDSKVLRNLILSKLSQLNPCVEHIGFVYLAF